MNYGVMYHTWLAASLSAVDRTVLGGHMSCVYECYLFIEYMYVVFALHRRLYHSWKIHNVRDFPATLVENVRKKSIFVLSQFS